MCSVFDWLTVVRHSPSASIRRIRKHFFGGLCLTFQFFGGIPRRAIFDNAKVTVKSGVGNCISQWILKREGLGC